MSDLCGTVAAMVTPKGSMSAEGETLQVSKRFSTNDMLLSAVSVLVVAQPSSEVPEGLTNIQLPSFSAFHDIGHHLSMFILDSLMMTF
jgi:hypothetical protein